MLIKEKTVTTESSKSAEVDKTSSLCVGTSSTSSTSSTLTSSSNRLISLNKRLLLSSVKLTHNSHMVDPPGLFNSLGTCSPNADLFGDPCSRSLISSCQRQEPINYRLSKFSSSRHRKLQPLRES